MARYWISKWRTGGENVTAECAQRDECDWEFDGYAQRDECDWEFDGYAHMPEVTRAAKEHSDATGHPVEMERSQFRIVERRG